MLVSGIDLHKRTIAIQTVDGEGTVVCQARRQSAPYAFPDQYRSV